ncbi:hypothetical protein [Alkalihalobacillus sp. BA299]|nr:hypothetical protein [Alkalihalobacillus sp. BA299]
MGWLGDMFVIVLVGLINIIAAIILGTYWLKNERYPWEKPEDV